MTTPPGPISRPRRRLSVTEVADLKRSLDAVDRDDRAAGLLRRLLLDQVVNDALDTFDLDELLRRLVSVATSVLDAERGTIFLHDRETDELVSRVTEGGRVDVIRLPSHRGVAGRVFTSGRALLVQDAYAHPDFYPGVDEVSGYRTRSIVCAPIFSANGGAVGVSEMLNKRSGHFDEADLHLLGAINAQAVAGIEQAALIDRLNRLHAEDRALLAVTEDVASDLRLDELLRKIAAAASRLLDAERSTVFLLDPERHELVSRVAEHVVDGEIRLPADAGIAGAVLTTGEAAMVADAYADPRFEPGFDRRTGFRTTNLVCVPIMDRTGQPIGVLQTLNRRHGRFSEHDCDRLQMLAHQVASSIANARTLREIVELRQQGDAVLRAMSAAVIALSGDRNVTRVNEAARRVLRLRPDEFVTGDIAAWLGTANPWLLDMLDFVGETGRPDMRADAELRLPDGTDLPANIAVSAVHDEVAGVRGFVVSIEDLTREKKLRGTVARYIAQDVLDRLLDEKDGATRELARATVLFSDIRQFTALTEAQSASDIAAMLDEYFDEMVRIVERHRGVLDKFIGDAIMAVFGTIRRADDDAARAAKVATEMIVALRELNRRRTERGLNAIEIGVGLATGDVLSGPIGAATRMDYTVIGDSVNLASRLEGATKQYGAAVLLDDATAARLPRSGLLRPLDLIRVKGKSKPVEVFECLDHLPEEKRPAFEALLPHYTSGVGHYRARRWADALTCFQQALVAMPADGPSWVYADRCLYYRRKPPPDTWDGVWQMTGK